MADNLPLLDANDDPYELRTKELSAGLHVPYSVPMNSSGTETGTAGAPLRTDPVGTTTQPVSGTVAATSAAASQADGHSATIGALADADTALTLVGLLKKIKSLLSGTMSISASSLPLPTSAATSTLQTTGNTSLASIDSKITAVNTGATVVTSSALPTGAATDAGLATIAGLVDGLEAATGTTADADSATTVIGRLKKLVALFAGGLPAALTAGGNLKVAILEAIPAGTNNIGDVDVLSTVAPTAATATLTNVTASATSVQLLASTSTRKGGSFFNDSTARLYLKHGTTASTTSFTVILEPGGYYELPAPIYTGRIDGILSAATGAVRITEHS